MTIDNRILIPFVTPPIILVVIRLLYLLPGAEWSGDVLGFMAGASLVVGFFIGVGIAFVMLIEGFTIGHIRIGKSKESDE